MTDIEEHKKVTNARVLYIFNVYCSMYLQHVMIPSYMQYVVNLRQHN